MLDLGIRVGLGVGDLIVAGAAVREACMYKPRGEGRTLAPTVNVVMRSAVGPHQITAQSSVPSSLGALD